MTGIDRSTLADLVARLLAQGYLQRRRTKDDAPHQCGPDHRRRQANAQMSQPGADEVDKLVLAAVPPAHRKPFTEALAILSEEMDKVEANGEVKPAPKIKTRRRA